MLLVVVEVRVYRPGDGKDFVEVGEGAPGEGAEDGFAVDVDGGDGDAGQVDVAYLVDGADAGGVGDAVDPGQWGLGGLCCPGRLVGDMLVEGLAVGAFGGFGLVPQER